MQKKSKCKFQLVWTYANTFWLKGKPSTFSKLFFQSLLLRQTSANYETPFFKKKWYPLFAGHYYQAPDVASAAIFPSKVTLKWVLRSTALRILMSMQAIKKRKLGELCSTEPWQMKLKNGYHNDDVPCVLHADRLAGWRQCKVIVKLPMLINKRPNPDNTLFPINSFGWPEVASSGF